TDRNDVQLPSERYARLVETMVGNDMGVQHGAHMYWRPEGTFDHKIFDKIVASHQSGDGESLVLFVPGRPHPTLAWPVSRDQEPPHPPMDRQVTGAPSTAPAGHDPSRGSEITSPGTRSPQAESSSAAPPTRGQPDNRVRNSPDNHTSDGGGDHPDNTAPRSPGPDSTEARRGTLPPSMTIDFAERSKVVTRTELTRLASFTERVAEEIVERRSAQEPGIVIGIEAGGNGSLWRAGIPGLPGAGSERVPPWMARAQAVKNALIHSLRERLERHGLHFTDEELGPY